MKRQRTGERKRELGSDKQKLPASALRHVGRSLQKQWKRYRKELKRCQKKFSKKSIHDSRVAARRLLATIDLIADFLPPQCAEKTRRVIKEQLDLFSDLRDTQVQLATVNSLQAIFPAARMFCEWLEKVEQRLMKKTCGCVKRIKIRRLVKLIWASEQDFKKRVKKTSGKAAASLLLRAVDRAFRRTAQLRTRIDRDRTETIHKTRVAFKRFRYMIELLAAHLRADEKMLGEMQHYQTMMGDIQDAEVLLQSFEKFARKKKIRTASARQLREELVRRREWLIKMYLDAAGQLTEFWPVRGGVT